jgi:DNA polymerase-3 subunit alpha
MSELLAMEKESCGLYLTGNPMDAYQSVLENIHTTKIQEVLDDYESEIPGQRFPDGKTVMLAGIISRMKMKTTKNNSMMAYLDLDDGTASAECIVFSRILTQYGGYIREDNAILAQARINVRENQPPKFICEAIGPITDATADAFRTLPTFDAYDRGTRTGVPDRQMESADKTRLYLRLNDQNREMLPRVQAALRVFNGDVGVVLYDEPAKRKMLVTREHWVRPDETLLRLLKMLLGDENVVLKNNT